MEITHYDKDKFDKLVNTNFDVYLQHYTKIPLWEKKTMWGKAEFSEGWVKIGTITINPPTTNGGDYYRFGDGYRQGIQDTIKQTTIELIGELPKPIYENNNNYFDIVDDDRFNDMVKNGLKYIQTSNKLCIQFSGTTLYIKLVKSQEGGRKSHSTRRRKNRRRRTTRSLRMTKRITKRISKK